MRSSICKDCLWNLKAYRGAAFFDQTSIATPAAIIGRFSYCPMLTV
jgi:hypothetical protein